MANIRKFDRHNVLHKASHIFWAKGYAGTSIRDIQDAVNMRPGSIYAAFESKEGLYREALILYSKRMLELLNQHTSQAPSIAQGLQAFVEYVILDTKKEAPTGICMLFRANGEFYQQNQTLFEFSQALLMTYEEKMTEVFALAKERGELSPQFDEKAAGQQFVIQFTGLRNYLNGRNHALLAKPLISKMITSVLQSEQIIN